MFQRDDKFSPIDFIKPIGDTSDSLVLTVRITEHHPMLNQCLRITAYSLDSLDASNSATLFPLPPSPRPLLGWQGKARRSDFINFLLVTSGPEWGFYDQTIKELKRLKEIVVFWHRDYLEIQELV